MVLGTEISFGDEPTINPPYHAYDDRPRLTTKNLGIHEGGFDTYTVNRPERSFVWVLVCVCLKSPPHRFVIYLFPIPIEILSSSLLRPAHSDEFVRPVLSLSSCCVCNTIP